MCPFEGEVLAARIVDSFFSVTSIPVLRFSTSCLPPCPVFVLALFLWPLQWSVATAELLVSTQLRCITRPGVPASYLAPGVVFVCVHLRRKSSFMHALSLGPHTQGLGLCMFWVGPTSGQPGMAFWKASCLWNLYIHVSYRVISWTGLYVPIFYSTYTLKVPCTTCLIHPFMPIHATTCFYA